MTWWLQPGWTETRCACGAKIWPEGDPDWGACYSCFSADLDARYGPDDYPDPRYPCDICTTGQACAHSNGYAVCSQECHDRAEARPYLEPKEQ